MLFDAAKQAEHIVCPSHMSELMEVAIEDVIPIFEGLE